MPKPDEARRLLYKEAYVSRKHIEALEINLQRAINEYPELVEMQEAIIEAKQKHRGITQAIRALYYD